MYAIQRARTLRSARPSCESVIARNARNGATPASALGYRVSMTNGRARCRRWQGLFVGTRCDRPEGREPADIVARKGTLAASEMSSALSNQGCAGQSAITGLSADEILQKPLSRPDKVELDLAFDFPHDVRSPIFGPIKDDPRELRGFWKQLHSSRLPLCMPSCHRGDAPSRRRDRTMTTARSACHGANRRRPSSSPPQSRE